MKIGIVADDLTSATDGAVPFVGSGHACDVWFDHEIAPAVIADVTSIDKDSRSRSRTEAQERALAATRKVAGADVLYHTVDSTIRGHLETEVMAALKASGRKVALLAPAFPDAGRTTLAGQQMLNGEALHKTAYRHDPVHPITESRIRGHFLGLPDEAVRLLALQDVRRLGAEKLAFGAETLLIADAETQADLDGLIDSVVNPRDVLFCGSPGMARALAARFNGDEKPRLTAVPASVLLTVVGSVNSTSIAQRHAMKAKEGAVELIIDAAAATVSPQAAAHDALDKAKGQLAKATSLILTTGPVNDGYTNPSKITAAVAHAAASLIGTLPIDGLILTGGDTAAALFRKIGVTSITLAGEVEPGIPLGMISTPRSMTVVTKAGGFGSLNTLCNAATALRKPRIGVAA
jgi:D-threonate/D-erythronate kinase